MCETLEQFEKERIFKEMEVNGKLDQSRSCQSNL